jgi:hypothetical protein
LAILGRTLYGVRELKRLQETALAGKLHICGLQPNGGKGKLWIWM